MGNCASPQRAASWADGGEWESPPEEEKGGGDSREYVEKVKIRVTRRQLEELLEKAGETGRRMKWRQPAEALLADIMNAGAVRWQPRREAHWKPALQSIPEAAES